MNFRGGISSNTTNLLSDERIKFDIKFDDEEIINALNTINKLKVHKYKKYNLSIREDLTRLTDKGEGELEIWLIAQHIENIPELSHTVETSLIFDDETIAKKCKVKWCFLCSARSNKRTKTRNKNIKTVYNDFRTCITNIVNHWYLITIKEIIFNHNYF